MPSSPRPTVLVTSASFGVGLYATKSLVDCGWHVVMACRDLAKAKAAAEMLGIAADHVSLLQLDPGSQTSAHAAVDGFTAPVSMIDGQALTASEACQVTKRCNRIMNPASHRWRHAATGTVFNTRHPGCSAGLQTLTRRWYRKPTKWLAIAIASALLGTSMVALAAPATTVQINAPQVLLLGEVHDNPDAHRARLALLTEALQHDWNPAIAMEQFDREQQPLLDQAQRDCKTADCLIKLAGKSKWDWPLYAPLIQLALDYKLPLLAANVSRADAGKAAREGFAAVFDAATVARFHLNDPLPAEIETGQIAAIIEGHCHMLTADDARPLIKAQIARDVSMASRLLDGVAQQRSAVLIAGNGHVRGDIGVVRWLPPELAANTQIHSFVEGAETDASAGVVHTVKPHPRPDPCAAFGKPAG